MNSSEPFVYYGTSDFAATILKGLLDAGLTPSLVVSTAGKPAGRGLKTVPTPVASLAAERSLELLETNTLKAAEVQARLTQAATSYAVLAAFGKIVPQVVLDLYPKGIINVHPSLLPHYRGPAPMQYALRDGLTKTGVSLILLDAEVDHGPLLAQAPVSLEPTYDAPALSAALAQTSIKLLLKTIPAYLHGTVQPVAQDHTKATFTTMVTRTDGEANFTKTADELNNQRRAFTPWPGLWTTWHGKRLKLIATHIGTTSASNPVGTVNVVNDQLHITCGQGSLAITTVQLEGGKSLPAPAFLRGHSDFVGTRLPS